MTRGGKAFAVSVEHFFAVSAVTVPAPHVVDASTVQIKAANAGTNLGSARTVRLLHGYSSRTIRLVRRPVHVSMAVWRRANCRIE
jgi:hypothetical protein